MLRTGEAHLVLLARLSTRLSAKNTVAHIAEHQQARLNHTRRLPDGVPVRPKPYGPVTRPTLR